jgi:hypothetical protein
MIAMPKDGKSRYTKEIMTHDGLMFHTCHFIERFDVGCGFADIFPIPDINAEAGTETAKAELYKWSSSSQAPWEINEGKPHVAFTSEQPLALIVLYQVFIILCILIESKALYVGLLVTYSCSCCELSMVV